MTSVQIPLVNLDIKDYHGRSIFPERSFSRYQGLLKGQHLQIEGDTVYWIKNGLTFRRLTYRDETVIAAEFANFEGHSGTAAVVFVVDMAYIYFDHGKSYAVNMPFAVQRVAKYDRGLILERDTTYDEKQLPKFYTLIDPILEIGLVASSSTSAFSKYEQIIHFDGTTCVTYSQGCQIQIYHARYLSRSKTSFKHRQSKRKSSLLPRHDESNSGDVPIDQRLSFSRTETGALDRMGDFTEEESYQFSLDTSDMRKDIILTLLDKYAISCPVNKIKVESVRAHGQEAVAIVNKFKGEATVILLAEGDSPKIEDTGEIVANDIGVVRRKDGTGYFLIMNKREVTLLSPLVDVESPALAVPEEWGQNLEIVATDGNTVAMKNNDNDQVYQFQVMIEPQEEFIEDCFNALTYVVGLYPGHLMRFIWAAVTHNESINEWKAFEACFLVSMLPSFEFEQVNLLLYHYEMMEPFAGVNEFQNKRDAFLCLHLLREECKLDITKSRYVSKLGWLLSAVASLAGFDEQWCRYYECEDIYKGDILIECDQPEEIPDAYDTLIKYCNGWQDDGNDPGILRMSDISAVSDLKFTPQLARAIELFRHYIWNTNVGIEVTGMTQNDLYRYPEGVRFAIIYRLDVLDEETVFKPLGRGIAKKSLPQQSKENTKDVRTIASRANTSEQLTHMMENPVMEDDTLAISRLIFDKDRRFYEVTKMLQTSRHQTEVLKLPQLATDHEVLTLQQEYFKIVANRTMAQSLGRAAVYFSSRRPLLTEKYFIGRLNFSLLLQPNNTTVNMQRNSIAEESLQMGYFHQGVAAGLMASRSANVTGSWVIFNKPQNLTSQHAGFLLGLGLNGHLKDLEEWHIYNYLGPKHQHTSLALLIGMAASKMGSMDTKLTKVLSVHVSALLPAGSNNLNVSMNVQTAGLVGIGLLYCNTQHRRMSELMLNEISAVDRDEGYRLAAGIALGLINLGKGDDLKGLHDMHLVERLLELAVSSRDVQSSRFDETVPGAIVALLLIFLKTNNEAVARKLDVPETEQLLDYVRPDFLFLRVLAKNLIMWDSIGQDIDWVSSEVGFDVVEYLENTKELNSDQMSRFNIIGGAALTMGLRWCSTGNERVETALVKLFTYFFRMLYLYPSHTFDARMAMRSVLNVLGSIIYAMGALNAGTGSLSILPLLRMVHVQVKHQSRYGLFMANELAMGLLFLGGGQWGLTNSDFAIASMVMAFYPILPEQAKDDMAHLQALRHFWVFAVQPRCLVTRHVDTKKPVKVNVQICKKDGSVAYSEAPCLLPHFSEIEYIETDINSEFDAVYLTKFDDLNVYMSPRKRQPELATELKGSLDLPPISRLNCIQRIERVQREEIFKNVSLQPTPADLKFALQEMIRSPKSVDDLWNIKLVLAVTGSYDLHKYLNERDMDELRHGVWQLRRKLELTTESPGM